MFKTRRTIRLGKTLNRSSISPAIRRAKPFSKQSLRGALHVMGPTLTALVLVGAVSGVADAQGTISFGGAQTVMQTVQTFAEFAGAVICVVGIIFSGVSFMSGNIQRGVIGLFGAIFGAGVLGWGVGWISSHTGQSVS